MSTEKDNPSQLHGPGTTETRSPRLTPRTIVGDTGTEAPSIARAVDIRLDVPADAYSVVEDGTHAFVLAGWRVDDAVVRSRRFACRMDDETVTQVGVRNTHHVDETTETTTWAQEFLDGREDRALAVARRILARQGRPPRKPFDGRV